VEYQIFLYAQLALIFDPMASETLTSPQIWMLAIRPKTLPASAASTIVGSALAYHDGRFLLLPALACLLTALLLQIGANLANDLFDFHRGADTAERLGPIRVTQAGLMTPAQVRSGMIVVFGLAVLLGVYLIWVAGWPVLVLGAASILAALVYTGGPFPYGYYGLGDLMVFIFFGPVAVCGTYFIQAGGASRLSWLASIPMGLLIVAILVVNNLRDIRTDTAAGKHTLAVRLGVTRTRWEYSLCLILAYLSVPLIWLAGATGPWVLLAFLSLPLAYRQNQAVWTQEGRPLNQALAGTGQLTLVFGLLLSLGLLI
jgi:1,4-dihydroxy-2-naphthoate polyprenyltransferase